MRESSEQRRNSQHRARSARSFGRWFLEERRRKLSVRGRTSLGVSRVSRPREETDQWRGENCVKAQERASIRRRRVEAGQRATRVKMPRQQARLAQNRRRRESF